MVQRILELLALLEGKAHRSLFVVELDRVKLALCFDPKRAVDEDVADDQAGERLVGERRLNAASSANCSCGL
jgi:hypothetical protein